MQPKESKEEAEDAFKALQNIADTEAQLDYAITGFGQGPIITALKVGDLLGKGAAAILASSGDTP